MNCFLLFRHLVCVSLLLKLFSVSLMFIWVCCLLHHLSDHYLPRVTRVVLFSRSCVTITHVTLLVLALVVCRSSLLA